MKRFLLFISVVALMITPMDVQAGDGQTRIWGRVADLTVSRGEMGAAVLDGRIHLVGGFIVTNNQLDYTDLHEVYDPVTDTWETLAPLPVRRHHPITVAYDGKLYAFGGSSQLQFTPSATVFVYDPEIDAWEQLADMPATRLAAGAVVIDDMIYVAGGVGMPADNLLRYAPATDEWELLPPTSVTRDSSAIVAFQDQIWVIAGRSASDFTGREYSSVEIFDPATGEWSFGPDVQVPRAGFSAGVIGDNIIITGGEILLETMTTTTEESTEIYDPSSGEWIFGRALPFGLHATATAVVDDVMYVMGGATSFSISSRVYVFVDRADL